MNAKSGNKIFKNVLILGGYGLAGQTIAAALSEQIHGCITIAGRNFTKAQECVPHLQKTRLAAVSFVPLAVDVTQPSQLISALKQQDLVIVCVGLDEQITKNIIETALDNSADYIDIVPGSGKYRVFKEYETKILEKHRRFILDAGADPGLPGWLARYAASQVENAKEVVLFAKYRNTDIGPAGIQDILDHTSLKAEVYANDKWETVPPWRLKWIQYPGGFGRGLSIPIF